MDCKLHWYPKFFNHSILFIGSKIWIFLIIGSKLEMSQRFNQNCNYNKGNYLYHQNIVYCLSLKIPEIHIYSRTFLPWCAVKTFVKELS